MHKLRIGLSASFSHPDPTRALFKGKRLTLAEESLTHWLTVNEAVVYVVASRPDGSYDLVADDLDGLVLQGGADVAPEQYGEAPLKPEWGGDAYRDAYELKLFKACLKKKVPVLGVCRGLQLINVAMGGTLYQDITTQVPGSHTHRDWEIYDQNRHEVALVAGKKLAKLYGRTDKELHANVNSVHHQGIKKVAPNFEVEAISVPDGIPEAIRFTGEGYLFAIQWHPEFQTEADQDLLPTDPLLQDFLAAVRKRTADR